MRRASSALAAEYHRRGWWTTDTLSAAVTRHAVDRPDGPAYTSGSDTVSWAELDAGAWQLARLLAGAGVSPGDRVAVCLPDGIGVHLAFLGIERLGAVVVGVGAKAGTREIAHLLGKSRSGVLITGSGREGVAQEMLGRGVVIRHLVLGVDGGGPRLAWGVDAGSEASEIVPAPLPSVEPDPDELFLINSTSGTTGLPKAVLHTQNRWHYFHTRAVANGDLRADDVVLAIVPAPFGFGLWTSHVTPIKLGAHTVVLPRFDARTAALAIEEHGVTVLCCVSTQFVMMLADGVLDGVDLSSLRVVFTGGELVPYRQAHEFEARTGATILQFYGSNETGLLSGTTLEDTAEKRLRTAGQVVSEMNVRLYDGEREVTAGGRGQPACWGPGLSLGYLDDDAANHTLFTRDGWMLMGDICEIDADGYLSVVGRISEFVVRGGKNISLAVVEDDALSHPAVRQAAAVPMPDPVLGERVCLFVELLPGEALDLDALVTHLAAQGVSRELFPERLEVVDELPRSSGAKVAKSVLRERIAELLAAEAPGRPFAASHLRTGART
ncbi:acyl--CoA ligase [Nocardioides sp. LMS-CY]|uniref:class I adenylate-forming enzyme family protein n=1 Tax=Nocardioides sp. (strain LMS-CY) TaxID=2840457 RepID=UPI001C00548D|nr:class I adenylate-forming enzyme family protein [Nocardioides sp. LMS-CY]QWF22142.1 acyl--CoA ligase [Nocardioides sp. LMS-CY]